MNIESITSASVRALAVLVERHEKLRSQMEEVQSQLTSLLGGSLPSEGKARKGRPPKSVMSTPKQERRTRRQKPGSLKERILAVLRASGEPGITVADIASKLSVPKAHVHVWFSTTGKRLVEVRKVEPGRFRIQETAAKKK